MRLRLHLLPTLLLLALLSTCAFAQGKPNKADIDKCNKKNRDVVQAIKSFCKPDLIVPSRYAYIGRHSKNLRYYMAAKGTNTCRGKQWKVPRGECLKYGYNMCAKGKKDGANVNYYGPAGCQKWMIAAKMY